MIDDGYDYLCLLAAASDKKFDHDKGVFCSCDEYLRYKGESGPHISKKMKNV